MELVDTHCHIHDKSAYKFMVGRQRKQTMADFSVEEIFKRMDENGVKKAVCVGTSHEDSMVACRFAERYDNVYWSYGVHPEEAEAWLRHPSLPSTLPTVPLSSLVAIGEVGLDYHSEGYDREAQIKMFEEMIDLALRNELPMIFHVREAFDDFYAVLDNFHGVRGVVHSFSDTMENMEKALGRGFYIGVNGLATFADLPMAPIERVLLETDSPFLAPVPFRGQVNDPSHILDIAKWVAKKYHLELKEVAEITTDAVGTLFGLNNFLR